MYISPKLEVRGTSKGKALFARTPIKKQEVLIRFEGKILDHPTKYTLQIDLKKHLEGPGAIDDYINHSCEPNTYVHFPTLILRALKIIQTGEEITQNYLATEYALQNQFHCQCGTKTCLKKIHGFKYLTLQQKQSLRPLLSPYLHSLLESEEKQL